MAKTMNRHEAREAALGLVFERSFKPDEDSSKLYELAKEERALEEDEYVRRVTAGVFENLERIDALIEGSAKGWKINRMPGVSLALMRICVYEMLFEADIPINVSLNEAVELAKKFDGDDAPAFVNGVLNKISKNMPEKA
ncbi:MAG: transcription antitermination factor NusB [Clostridia bacterium]|nr:transcription antitermination factor NusB [Clostridia bacterium]